MPELPDVELPKIKKIPTPIIIVIGGMVVIGVFLVLRHNAGTGDTGSVNPQTGTTANDFFGINTAINLLKDQITQGNKQSEDALSKAITDLSAKLTEAEQKDFASVTANLDKLRTDFTAQLDTLAKNFVSNDIFQNTIQSLRKDITDTQAAYQKAIDKAISGTVSLNSFTSAMQGLNTTIANLQAQVKALETQVNNSTYNLKDALDAARYNLFLASGGGNPAQGDKMWLTASAQKIIDTLNGDKTLGVDNNVVSWWRRLIVGK